MTDRCIKKFSGSVNHPQSHTHTHHNPLNRTPKPARLGKINIRASHSLASLTRTFGNVIIFAMGTPCWACAASWSIAQPSNAAIRKRSGATAQLQARRRRRNSCPTSEGKMHACQVRLPRSKPLPFSPAGCT